MENPSSLLAYIQTFGIITSFLLTVITIHRQSKYIKVNNSLTVAQHHSDLWKTILSNEPNRIFVMHIDLTKNPITEKEFMFTNMIFLHMSAVLKAQKAGAIYQVDGMERDIKDIFKYPIPKAVWADVCRFHDKMFVEFVSNNIPTMLRQKNNSEPNFPRQPTKISNEITARTY